MDTPEGLRGGAPERGGTPDPGRPERPDFDPILRGGSGAPKNEKRAKDPKDPKDPRKNGTFTRPLEKFRNRAKAPPKPIFRFSRIPSSQTLDPLDPKPLFHSWKPTFWGGPQLDPSWTRARSAPEKRQPIPPPPPWPPGRANAKAAPSVFWVPTAQKKRRRPHDGRDAARAQELNLKGNPAPVFSFPLLRLKTTTRRLDAP